MVQVEEVPEEILLQEGEHESDFETSSSASEASDLSAFSDGYSPADETIYDRLAALKDMVPPETRLVWGEGYRAARAWAAWSFDAAGNVAWWVSTSAILVGLPLALAIEDETRLVQQEREMQMQQQGQQQVSLRAGGAGRVPRGGGF